MQKEKYEMFSEYYQRAAASITNMPLCLFVIYSDIYAGRYLLIILLQFLCPFKNFKNCMI